jgi:hypothetical protein
MLLSSAASRSMTSTVCRAVNIIFSEHFIEDFKQVNDRKTRRDHETSNLNRDFWIRASIAHNSCIDGTNKVKSSPISRTRFGDSNNVVLAANHHNDNDGRAVLVEPSNAAGSTTRTAASIDYILFSADSDNEQEEDKDDAEEYAGSIFPDGDCHLHDLANDKQINLLDVSHLDTHAFKSKITGLFKMRNTV